jgi:hypothetical protein
MTTPGVPKVMDVVQRVFALTTPPFRVSSPLKVHAYERPPIPLLLAFPTNG